MIKRYKIYKIVNDIDDKVYIGSTRTKLNKRMQVHRYDARTPSNIKKLSVHMRNLGISHFKIELIKEIDISEIKIGRIQELFEYWKIPIENRLNSLRPYSHNREKTRDIMKKRASRRAYYNRRKQDPTWMEAERHRNKLRMREKRKRN